MLLVNYLKRLLREVLDVFYHLLWRNTSPSALPTGDEPEPATQLQPELLPPPRTSTNLMAERFHLAGFNRTGHIGHAKRCLVALPQSKTDLDASRIAIAFYCIGTMDLLGIPHDGMSTADWELESWKEWLWAQYTRGRYGTGFRPGPFMTLQPPEANAECSDYDTPHVIMTYTALLTLAMMRDDFSKLDRRGLIYFLRACQLENGSFSTVPGNGESDLRNLYCAFAISHLLDDWSGIDIDRALSFVASCRTYEGGYGQEPSCEAQGGTTYIALASLYLAPSSKTTDPLTSVEKQQTIHWLLHNQTDSGGFAGRTGKEGDSCYCFWCGASLKILGADQLVETRAIASFLSECQFKYGGIAKCPGEHPDPYHTYLSVAALCMYPPSLTNEEDPESWKFSVLDPLINARIETANWAKRYISGKVQ